MRSYTNDDNNIYSIKDLDIILDDIKTADIITKQKRGKSQKAEYYNVSCAFDIETSSWIDDDIKKATMYIWQFGIDGYVVVGRTWQEFIELINKVAKVLKTNSTRHLVCYIHNMGFEMFFMKKWFDWEDIFEVSELTPIKATLKNGIEFRCSYALSGKGLAKLSDDLTKYKIEKKVGDLDYKLIRHNRTPLTDAELLYCINDVKVVMSYIQEKLENEGILHIPLTATGYIRKLCKDACYGKGDQRTEYSKLMRSLTLTDDVYQMCKRAFQGGYVHCNPIYSCQKLTNVAGFDFTSSYPTALMSEALYPVSPAMRVKLKSQKEYETHIKYYAVISDITFKNIKLKPTEYCAPISESKCVLIDGEIVDNGRVISADSLTTTITDVDYNIYKDFYDWDSIEIGKTYEFYRGYIPKAFFDVMLDLYERKTALKDATNGDPELEFEYLALKGALNSVYGMMATDIMKLFDSIEEHNNSYSRFVYFPWSLYCTAIARRNLFTGIKEAGKDFVYSDTDSLKMLNYERHMDYINEYNKTIQDKLKKALKHYNIDVKKIMPTNCKGERKPLGIWDFEGVYDEFKAIRAKAYISKKGDEYDMKVSGLNPEKALKYLKTQGNPIDLFKDGMYIPSAHTGHTAHQYLEEEITGTITDYLGVENEYHEFSCIYVDEMDYTLKIEDDPADKLWNLFKVVIAKETD